MNMRITLFFSILLVAAAAYGATPAVNVTVADASGKVAYKGKTNSAGTFATGKLQPGEYVVQFNAANLRGIYAIVTSAGKKKVTANAVAGEKFAKGGIAMKVPVGLGLNISGQVAEAGGEMTSVGGAKVKVMNGKRYVWVSGSTGSNIGGHWAEEGSAEAINVQQMSKKSIGDMLERGRGAREGE